MQSLSRRAQSRAAGSHSARRAGRSGCRAAAPAHWARSTSGAIRRRRYLGIEIRTRPRPAIARARLDEVIAGRCRERAVSVRRRRASTASSMAIRSSISSIPGRCCARTPSCCPRHGTVLICIPNVDHWSFAERLLRGTFDYEDSGLFDRTHLRWFTWETTRKAIVAAGLQPARCDRRAYSTNEAAERFASALAPGLQALGVDPSRIIFSRGPAAAISSGARAAPSMPQIDCGLDDAGAGRRRQPCPRDRAVARARDRLYHDDHASRTGSRPSRSATTLRRSSSSTARCWRATEGLEPIRRLIALGYVVVCEFDDHPDYIPVLQRPDIQNFRAVHAVQTSTEPLAEVLRRDNPEVAVFPNAVQRVCATRATSPTRTG